MVVVRSTTSSSAAKILIFLFTTKMMIFILLTTRADDGYDADTKYCIGGYVNDGSGTYPKKVNHVLNELARVAPTKYSLSAVAIFPNDAPGSVQGTAFCTGTNDANRCAECLHGLRQLLIASCSYYEGGGAKGGMICKMAFGIVH